MALFKISKGISSSLPQEKTAGYCWYTIDDSLFYIDYEDENGEVQRKALNAKDAETLLGMSLEEIQNSISWNNLLDKPFGEVETEGAVLVPETTFSGTTTTTISLGGFIRFGDYYHDSIVVEFDGTKYTTQMWTEYTGGADIYGVGDVDLDTTYGDYFSNDTGLPFCVIQESTGTDMCSLSASDDAEHIIKIYVPGMATKQLDEIYIPDTISRTNHTHSYDDLNDKPFYDATTATTIFDEQTVQLTSQTYSPSNYDYSVRETNDITVSETEFTIGDTYRVTLNGTTYTCTVIQGGFAPTIGAYDSWDMANSNSEYPFSINHSTISVRTEDEEVTLKIERIDGELKQLDDKFIPDTISRTDHIHSYSDLADKPFYESGTRRLLYNISSTSFDAYEAGGKIKYTPVGSSFMRGRAYTVIYDGVTYAGITCHSDSYEAWVLGSYYASVDASNNEVYTYWEEDGDVYSYVNAEMPFYIRPYESQLESYLEIITLTSGVHSIEIYEGVVEVKTIDDKFIPDSVVKISTQVFTDEQKTQARENIGAGVPQIQADYSQNDETAVDYIKNKPVYIETELETMDTFTFTSGTSNSKFGCARDTINDKTSELELGKKYTVIFDGTTYSDLVCYDSGFSAECMLGEYVSLAGGETPDFLEYPFSIVDEGDSYVIFTEGKSGSHNVEILKPIENVYFYEEFIPDTIARVSDIIEYSLSKTGTTITLMGTNDSVSTIEESVTTATDDDVGNVVLESASAITHVDEAVKQEIVSATLASLQTETLTFVLDDGTTVTKEVVVK